MRCEILWGTRDKGKVFRIHYYRFNILDDLLLHLSKPDHLRNRTQHEDKNFSSVLLYFMGVIYGVLRWIYCNKHFGRYVIMRYKDSKR